MGFRFRDATCLRGGLAVKISSKDFRKEAPMFFEIIGSIRGLETIAAGRGVRSRNKLRMKYGPGAWRKRKGTAKVRLADGTEREVEVHWYEAHGIGKKDFKIKKYVD